ncbi:MAG: deoxyribonuclease IV [Clostridia bacterium]|nr:deoxyribonuclease IV [Clostridia bacterium]
MFKVGCHISIAGGYEAMGRDALYAGANTFQYFTRNPRGSKSKTPSPDDIEALRRLMDENGFFPALAHAPYTYNPCAKDPHIRQYTAEAMADELRLLEYLPGSLYNFHPGCHVGQGVEAGIVMIADMLNAIMTPAQSTTVLLETMAGKGTEIGGRFEELRAILDLLTPEIAPKVGVCLDTCHIHDGGYDIAGDTDAVLAEFDRVVGLDRLYAIHLNDSKNPLGAHKDRHEKIGEGSLTLDGIRRIINHPALRDKPFYLETPCNLDGYKKEIALLKSEREDA